LTFLHYYNIISVYISSIYIIKPFLGIFFKQTRFKTI